MKEVEINIRVNEGWNNYPAKVTVKVDDKLHQIFSILQDRKCFLSGNEEPDDKLYYCQMGVMSKDSGYGWVSLSKKQYGQGIGMFYGGIGKGEQYLDLNEVRKEGEYRYEDLLKTKR